MAAANFDCSDSFPFKLEKTLTPTGARLWAGLLLGSRFAFWRLVWLDVWSPHEVQERLALCAKMAGVCRNFDHVPVKGSSNGCSVSGD